MSTRTLHLFVIQGDTDREPVLATEGPFGCDYVWNDDFTAYRCAPHRWRPGSNSSYAAYQAGDFVYGDDSSEVQS